jgi:hypothetical protein
MKECLKCKKVKHLEEFNFKSKTKNLRHSHCKECTRLFVKNHYNNNKGYYLDKTKKRNSELRMTLLVYVRDHLSKNPCVDCGESDVRVLEFDHEGKIPKLMAISSLIKARVSTAIIQEEINKCQVRCANCHRRKTSIQFNWFKGQMLP